jgi:hypothetical protein
VEPRRAGAEKGPGQVDARPPGDLLEPRRDEIEAGGEGLPEAGFLGQLARAESRERGRAHAATEEIGAKS